METPGLKSQNQLDLLKKIIANPNYSGLYGISIERGDGCHIIDVDGNRYLDCLAAASTNCLGYNNEKVVTAYTNAALNMQHAGFLYSPNKQALDLAQKLIKITPGTFDKRVMFGLSGSDACDGAIKATRRYTNNLAIIHFKNDYHGSTGLSMAASDFSKLNDGLFDKNNLFIELDFPKNDNDVDDVIKIIKDLFKKNKAGGILLEAIQGDAGVQIAPNIFFKQLKKLTEKYNKVLMVDEVQSGMMRTGKWWGILHFDIEPDILITAKGLSGGYAPISAVIGKTDILNSLGHGQHLFTYAGHAPSAAVALEVINQLELGEFEDKNSANGNKLLSIFNAFKDEFPDIIVGVRGKGLMLGVEINVSVNELAGKVFATRCVEKGLYVGFFGVNGQVVRVEPPYTIGNDEINFIKQVFGEVLVELQNGDIPQITYQNVKTYSVGL